MAIYISTNIYSSKECNISFERAQNILSRRKKVVFMEANNIFKKNFKPLKIDKNNSQNLSKQKKKCKITLLYEFEVRI